MLTDPQTTAADKIEAMERTKKSAFLALFCGAKSHIMIYRHKDGEVQPPCWGKSECEWVLDWEDFYFRELVGLGFMQPEKLRTGPALGMGDGKEWTFEEWDMRITEEGFSAREAYYAAT